MVDNYYLLAVKFENRKNSLGDMEDHMFNIFWFPLQFWWM